MRKRQQTIELLERQALEPKIAVKKSIFRKVFDTIYYSAVLTLLLCAATGAAYIGDQLPHRTQIKEIPVPFTPPEKDIVEKIKDSAHRNNIPWQIPVAIYLHETGNGKWFYRFEESQMRKAAKFDSFIEEQRMLASSHGPMHVMGLTALTDCNLHWTKLYSDAGIECGVSYIAKAWNRFKALNKETRLRRSLLEYNGGADPTYPDKVLAKLAVIIMKEI